MNKKHLVTSLGAGAAALALALAPLAPASASTSSWGVWSQPLIASPADNTLDFAGTGMINATWILGGAASYEVLDTQSEDEFFSAGTPIGSVFGANGPSVNTNFLKVTSQNNTSATATLTVTFASAVPAGLLGFAVSDLDTDHVTVSATDASGNALTGEQLIGTANPVEFNFCAFPNGPSCSDTAVPSIAIDPTDVYAVGSQSSSDGSTAWFQPSVAVKTVTFAYINDDPSNPSTSRYWFAQSEALPETGVSSTATAGMVGVGIALVTAGALLVIRRSRKA